jgi:3-hydroxymyristoyl/3-hydroxydecanoyl-(acyl carrier protein) dehydratase
VLDATVSPPAATGGPRAVTGESTLTDFDSIAFAHRAFLTTQTEVHQQFLQFQQDAGAVALAMLDTVDPCVPLFDRHQLERHALGAIAEVFGPRFTELDQRQRGIRIPRPPLLLVDRVMAITGECASGGTGTVRSEADIRADTWYVDHAGRMPLGIAVEAGQAFLILLSWLGADLHTREERVFRQLGCEMTWHGGLPKVGETLSYRMSLDGHDEEAQTRLFYYHGEFSVNGTPRLTVQHGQAGHFTEEAMAKPSGVSWDPNLDTPAADTRLDPPALRSHRQRFDSEAVRAFAEGRPADCFGAGWEPTRTHVRSPRIDTGRMLLLDEVTDVDSRGGPWRRGYLRAETPVTPDDWFFPAHFHNDPVMPGNLTLQAGFQAMAFYLAALGMTIDHDQWHFEPVPEQPCRIRFRGQVSQTSRRVVYEVFVSEMHSGPYPTLFADVFATADGLPIFHARRLGVRLVPDHTA